MLLLYLGGEAAERSKSKSSAPTSCQLELSWLGLVPRLVSVARTTVKDLDRLVAQIDDPSVAQIWWPLEGFRRVARTQNVPEMCCLYTLERNLMAIWQLWTFWTPAGELPGTHTGYRKPFPIEFLKTKILAIWQHLAF